jgi:excisionase family DNA binding protein
MPKPRLRGASRSPAIASSRGDNCRSLCVTLNSDVSKVNNSGKLLNTAEAARFLRVSEASIRRWSDAGLLPVRRIGGRRERRFREVDLNAYLGAGESSLPRRPEAVQTEVNVGGVPLPLHSHLATFYNTDAGRLRLTVPFFAEGIRAGQPCFLAANGDVLEAYVDALRAEGVDIGTAIQDGRFVAIDAPGASEQEALDFWEQRFWPALAGGQTVIRVVGEMSSERKGFTSDAEMMRYEFAFNMLAKRFPTVTLCQYDVREFDGETIFLAFRAHPDLFGLHLGSFLN